MYRNGIKDIQQYTKRCTEINNIFSTLLIIGNNETKKRTLGKNFIKVVDLSIIVKDSKLKYQLFFF